jgi:hypothetical protein
LCVVLVFSFMLGGIVPVINYLPYTLSIAGITDFYVRAGASISVAFVNFATALGTSLLINIIPTRTLLGFGYCVMFIATLSLALVVFFVQAPTSGYLAIALAMLFLIGNNGGVNSIIFFIFNELFDPEVTVVASTITLTVFNVVRFGMNFAFVPLQSSIGLSGTLLMSSCTICLTSIILMLYLPETNMRFVKKEIDQKKEKLTDVNIELEENGMKEQDESSSSSKKEKESAAMNQIDGDENRIENRVVEFQSVIENDLEGIK